MKEIFHFTASDLPLTCYHVPSHGSYVSENNDTSIEYYVEKVMIQLYWSMRTQDTWKSIIVPIFWNDKYIRLKDWFCSVTEPGPRLTKYIISDSSEKNQKYWCRSCFFNNKKQSEVYYTHTVLVRLMKQIYCLRSVIKTFCIQLNRTVPSSNIYKF